MLALLFVCLCVNVAEGPLLSKKLLLNKALNSRSDILFLVSHNWVTSFPTIYLKSGLPLVAAFNITLATSTGGVA